MYYGLVPQGRSASPGRAAAMDPLAVRDVPRVAAPLAGAARHGYGLDDLLLHDQITRTRYISISP